MSNNHIHDKLCQGVETFHRFILVGHSFGGNLWYESLIERRSVSRMQTVYWYMYQFVNKWGELKCRVTLTTEQKVWLIRQSCLKHRSGVIFLEMPWLMLVPWSTSHPVCWRTSLFNYIFISERGTASGYVYWFIYEYENRESGMPTSFFFFFLNLVSELVTHETFLSEFDIPVRQ